MRGRVGVGVGEGGRGVLVLVGVRREGESTTEGDEKGSGAKVRVEENTDGTDPMDPIDCPPP